MPRCAAAAEGVENDSGPPAPGWPLGTLLQVLSFVTSALGGRLLCKGQLRLQNSQEKQGSPP